MNNTMKEDLLRSISYERDINSSYLAIEVKSYKDLLEYQIQMVNNNPNHGILPIKVVFKDDKMMFFYDINSKESLKTYLSRTKISKSLLIRILQDITKSILDSKELLLYDNSFILNEEVVFIDANSLKINLVYIPIRMKGSINKDYKTFILDLLNTSISLDESYQGLFIERILSYINGKNFNLVDFLHELNYYESNATYNSKSQHLQELKIEEKSSNIVIKESKGEKKTKDTVEKCIRKKIYRPINVLIAAICQIIITVFLLFTQGSINSINEDPITTYLGLGLIIVAFDIFLFKKLFNKDSMIEKTVIKGKSNRTPIIKNHEKIVENAMVDGDDTAILIPKKVNYTDVLEHDLEPTNKAFIKDINNGKITNIQAIGHTFIIGRHIEHADYIINNKAVGRTHAEIVIKDNIYYLKDLNSKNGTMVNDMRLEAYNEYELKNEDIIVFGDSKHIFTVNDQSNITSKDMNVILGEEGGDC